MRRKKNRPTKRIYLIREIRELFERMAACDILRINKIRAHCLDIHDCDFTNSQVKDGLWAFMGKVNPRWPGILAKESSVPMKFSIPEPIPSGNVTLRSHWATRRRLLTRYEWQIHSICGPIPPRLPTRKMKVRIVSYRARLLDKDNLYAGAKILIDALRRTRLIRDDSPCWLELEVEQEVDRKNMRTEIEIMEIRK